MFGTPQELLGRLHLLLPRDLQLVHRGLIALGQEPQGLGVALQERGPVCHWAGVKPVQQVQVRLDHVDDGGPLGGGVVR